MSFVHLHSHTEASHKDSLNRVKDYVKRVKELGMDSAAITDHGVMYGVIDFYHACEKEDIKPILGCEVYVAPKNIHDKDPHNRYDHLVLLAENEKGYYNLQQICTKGFGDGFYFKPRVDDDILREYHEGIIALSACIVGRIPKHILKGDYDKAKECALYYNELFGEGNFFLELQDHGLPEQKTANAGIMRISQETGIELVATNDCHYTYKEDAEAHDILICMQQEKTINDPTRNRDDLGQWYVKSEDEMRTLFPYALEAIENTQKIADRCHVEIKFHETKMPDFPVPEGYTPWTYLNKLCDDGFNERYGDRSEEEKKKIHDMMDYQLGVIKSMGYVEYFLIVQEYCNWARNNGVPVGPGRGSGAGCLVTYCTGITDLEPLQYDLQFERFLNPARVSMPDIDVDFEVRGRGSVVEHCKEIYGKDNVCQIITFGTMASKEVIRDVGKVLDIPYSKRDMLSKLVPSDPKMTLKRALDESMELKEHYDSDPEVKELIDMAMRLEGLPKSTGTHAAGVIISRLPVNEYIPLAKAVDGESMVSQFTMTTVEELGLLKMDFLGLRNLSVEQDTLKNIKRNKGIDVSLSDIDYSDEEVYKHISTGNDDGVFQLESKGMQKFMTQLKPDCLEDLIAGVSLYRPGPMDYIPQYIEGKNNKETIRYDCPQLEPILKPTYGCIVYQEQVTRIVRDLAGYSMGDADNIRRAMSKKKDYVINEERKSFVYGDEKRGIPGCIKNGIDEQTANRIYDHMVDFAKYAFNKSHAACYAVISFQTAWLLHYYPTEYWAAEMTSVTENAPKLTSYIASAKALGINVLRPDINISSYEFLAEGSDVRYALCGLKGLSLTLARAIVKEREDNGKFKSFADTVERLVKIGASKDTIKNLIDTGAFDSFGHKRSQMNDVYISFMDTLKKEKKNGIEGQMSLFDLMGQTGEQQIQRIDFPDIPEYPQDILFDNEKEASGIYISGHPLIAYSDYTYKYSTAKSSDFEEDEESHIRNVYDGQNVSVVAIISEYKKVTTKKNETMAFVTVNDEYGDIECVIFPKTYQVYGRELVKDDKILIEGKVSISAEKGASIIADKVTRLDELPKTIFVRFPDMETYRNKEDDFKRRYFAKGRDRIVIYVEREKEKSIRPDCITMTDAILSGMEKLYGEENIIVKV